MTKENFKLAEDILEQISKLERIKSKIQIHYNQSQDSALKELLSDCNDVCDAYKDYKEKRFAEL